MIQSNKSFLINALVPVRKAHTGARRNFLTHNCSALPWFGFFSASYFLFYFADTSSCILLSLGVSLLCDFHLHVSLYSNCLCNPLLV